MTLGEVLIFDGHLGIHDAIIDPVVKAVDRDARLSMEVRVSCECATPGCKPGT